MLWGKRKKPEIPETDKGKELTIRQERFCQLFSRPGECFDNKTISYIVAYDKEEEVGGLNVVFSKKMKKQQRAYFTFGQQAYSLMKYTEIRARCQEILLEQFGDDKAADSETQWVIQQRKDLHAKMRGIEQRNTLRNRLKGKLPTSVSLGLIDDQFNRLVEQVQKRKKE